MLSDAITSTSPSKSVFIGGSATNNLVRITLTTLPDGWKQQSCSWLAAWSHCKSAGFYWAGRWLDYRRFGRGPLRGQSNLRVAGLTVGLVDVFTVELEKHESRRH